MANERRLIEIPADGIVRYSVMLGGIKVGEKCLDLNWLPTEEAVEVVRCRDCRWRGSENCTMFYRCDCGEQHTWETDNDFCSYGEKREVE